MIQHAELWLPTDEEGMQCSVMMARHADMAICIPYAEALSHVGINYA